MIILDLLIITVITTDIITLDFFSMSLIIIMSSLICSLAADSQWELAVDSLIRQEGGGGRQKNLGMTISSVLCAVCSVQCALLSVKY